MPHRTIYRGTTLIELMLSLTLSLLLLGLLSAIYWASANQDALRTDLSNLHDNSRFALQRLSTELEVAGFIGCPRLTADFPVSSVGSYSLNSTNKRELRQDSTGSTSITVRHRSSRINLLRTSMIQASVLDLSAEVPVAPGDILLISDCRHAELFQVARVSKQQGGQRLTAFAPLRYQYSEKAEVGQLEINTYFVDKTGRRDEGGQFISALYLKDLAGHRTEQVDGIQKLKVEEFRLDKEADSSGFSIQLELRQKTRNRIEYAFVAVRD